MTMSKRTGTTMSVTERKRARKKERQKERVTEKEKKRKRKKKENQKKRKQGRIHGYPSRVRVRRSSTGEGYLGIWAGAICSKSSKTPKK